MWREHISNYVKLRLFSIERDARRLPRLHLPDLDDDYGTYDEREI